jgi:hypothetical protein
VAGRAHLARLRASLDRPVDPAGLGAFRALVGALLCAGMLRLLASGWIPRLFGDDRFHFTYPGLGWVRPLPGPAAHALVAALALLAGLIAIGRWARPAAAAFALGFAYLEAIDVANYLNHYYLVVLLVGLLAALPSDRAFALDARGRPPRAIPAWTLGLVRLQIAVVYAYAGLAKLNPDWLLHAQPLNLWLTARTDTPVIGAWLDEPTVHAVASWAGFLFDTTIVGWLAWRRTRVAAYVALLGFHAMTHLLFNIGIFPFLMAVAALVFFPPDWPRALAARLGRPRSAPALALPPPSPRPALALAAAYAALQVVVPLRHLAYPGDVAWNEEGMRWSWKVMLREKHGSVTFRVRRAPGARELEVPPRRYLDARQEREMSGQPDLILQLAHHIADEHHAAGWPEVEVRVDALVSLNGRAPRRMIDPDRDLARVTLGLAPADWILPEPTGPPPTLRPRR